MRTHDEIIELAKTMKPYSTLVVTLKEYTQFSDRFRYPQVDMSKGFNLCIHEWMITVKPEASHL